LDNVLNLLPKHGVGLNLAILQYASPPFTLSSDAPDREEIARVVDESLDAGAYGMSILGGNYPLKPEASAMLIEETVAQGGYMTWHPGSASSAPNIDDMREALECANGHFMHLAHVNTFCRGSVRGELTELEEVQRLLMANPNIFSESYLSPLNYTRLYCEDGKPVSVGTRECLSALGFDETEDGIEEAILAHKCYVVLETRDDSLRQTGRKGLESFKNHRSDIGGMFPINPLISRVALAAGRRPEGDFIVDALSTDGGCIPRNVIVEMGLALVELDALTLEGFVRKTSWNPSRLLRLPNKGTLGIGMDADVTVLDLERKKAVATVAAGRVAMLFGEIVGHGTQVICTERGMISILENGLSPYLATPGKPPLGISKTRKW
jgi:hypothetical protein